MMEVQWRKEVQGIHPIAVVVRFAGVRPPGDVDNLIRSLHPEVTFRLVPRAPLPCGEVSLAFFLPGENRARVRFLGHVAGFETAMTVGIIRRLGGRGMTLSPHLRERLGWISVPLRLDLFIREGCGYCVPMAYLLAEIVRDAPTLELTILDADRCPDRAREAGVFAAPTLRIEGGEVFVGLPSSSEVVGRLLAAAMRKNPD